MENINMLVLYTKKETEHVGAPDKRKTTWITNI